MPGNVGDLISLKRKGRANKVSAILFHNNIVNFKEHRQGSKMLRREERRRDGGLKKMDLRQGKDKRDIGTSQVMIEIIPVHATSKTC